jgi:hypothetical protein
MCLDCVTYVRPRPEIYKLLGLPSDGFEYATSLSNLWDAIGDGVLDAELAADCIDPIPCWTGPRAESELRYQYKKKFWDDKRFFNVYVDIPENAESFTTASHIRFYKGDFPVVESDFAAKSLVNDT